MIFEWSDEYGGVGWRSLTTLAALTAVVFGSTAAWAARGSAPTAALQVGLVNHGMYAGPVDGLDGSSTRDAVRMFQRQNGLVADAVAGPETRAAFGRWGRFELGARAIQLRDSGWDVAELQFELAWHGFPSGFFNGVFGAHLLGALERFQESERLSPDGVAGPATIDALRSPLPTCPIRLAWPVRAAVRSPFGPRGFGFHSGVDLAAPFGTEVTAAQEGYVSWASFMPGGWGNLVVVTGRAGVQTLYAHLSEIDVGLGRRVSVGTRLGLVGATGDASGPHLHFEMRVRGAAVDPLPALDR
jgi:murein DD-endopeptidase MepM/ murein hydrolase activator NlpD